VVEFFYPGAERYSGTKGSRHFIARAPRGVSSGTATRLPVALLQSRVSDERYYKGKAEAGNQERKNTNRVINRGEVSNPLISG